MFKLSKSNWLLDRSSMSHPLPCGPGAASPRHAAAWCQNCQRSCGSGDCWGWFGKAVENCHTDWWGIYGMSFSMHNLQQVVLTAPWFEFSVDSQPSHSLQAALWPSSTKATWSMVTLPPRTCWYRCIIACRLKRLLESGFCNHTS